jgi:DNA-binding transcriptional MocR family regulator
MAHPGSGVAFVAASHANLAWIRSWLSIHEINPDKVTQARVGEFFKSLHDVDVHMHRQAEILFPKFRRLTTELRDRCHDIEGFATSDPDGGYFVPLWVPPGTARRIVDLCKEKGLLLTPAGSTHVGKVNALDNFIRLAPTYLSVHDITTAAIIIASAIRYAAEELVDMKSWADA